MTEGPFRPPKLRDKRRFVLEKTTHHFSFDVVERPADEVVNLLVAGITIIEESSAGKPAWQVLYCRAIINVSSRQRRLSVVRTCRNEIHQMCAGKHTFAYDFKCILGICNVLIQKMRFSVAYTEVGLTSDSAVSGAGPYAICRMTLPRAL